MGNDLRKDISVADSIHLQTDASSTNRRPRRCAALTTRDNVVVSRHKYQTCFIDLSTRSHAACYGGAPRPATRSQDVRIRQRVKMRSGFLIVLEGGIQEVHTSAVIDRTELSSR